jgi:hypothetical protein
MHLPYPEHATRPRSAVSHRPRLARWLLAASVLLSGAALAVEAEAESRKLYLTEITLILPDKTTERHADSSDKLTNVGDFYSSSNLGELFPTYPGDINNDEIRALLDLRGLTMKLRFAPNETFLQVVIPGVLNATFEGDGDRESSLEEFEDFLRGTGEQIEDAELKALLRALVDDSPVDPVAGNPNSLQAKMVQSDWRAGTRGFHVQREGAVEGIPNSFELGGNVGYARGCNTGCMDVVSLDLPLAYDWNLRALPLTLIGELPIAATWTRAEWSIMASAGLGARWHVGDGWAVTVMGRVGGVGSIDVGALALIYSAGIINRMEWDWRGFRVGMANQWTHLNTAEGIEIADIRIEYGLRNDVLRNGLDVSGDLGVHFGRAMNWSMFANYAHYFGSDLYSHAYGEAGVSVEVLRAGKTDRIGAMTFSLGYQGARDYNGLRFGFDRRF